MASWRNYLHKFDSIVMRFNVAKEIEILKSFKIQKQLFTHVVPKKIMHECNQMYAISSNACSAYSTW